MASLDPEPDAHWHGGNYWLRIRIEINADPKHCKNSIHTSSFTLMYHISSAVFHMISFQFRNDIRYLPNYPNIDHTNKGTWSSSMMGYQHFFSQITRDYIIKFYLKSTKIICFSAFFTAKMKFIAHQES